MDSWQKIGFKSKADWKKELERVRKDLQDSFDNEIFTWLMQKKDIEKMNLVYRKRKKNNGNI